MVRDSADADWRELLSRRRRGRAHHGRDRLQRRRPAILLASSAGAETAQLVRVDVATGATEVLAGDPVADVSGVKIHPDTREPQIVDGAEGQVGVRRPGPGRRRRRGGDPGPAPRRSVLPDADDADRIWLVGFTNDTGPVPYYAYDRQTGTSQFLFEHQPELSRYQLAAMEPFTFTARDGLTCTGT